MERMSTQSRRLAALEADVGTDLASAEQTRDFLEWLSTPSGMHAVRHYAYIRAERRWCHDNKHPTHGHDQYDNFALGWEHGWSRFVPEDERDKLMSAELQRLADDASGEPLFPALERWCDDTDGLADYWHDVDAAAFRTYLARERKVMDYHRSGTQPLAAEWRRRHAEWRPGMTEDEYDAWELDRLAAMMQEGNGP
jgi:hypothetical protein